MAQGQETRVVRQAVGGAATARTATGGAAATPKASPDSAARGAADRGTAGVPAAVDPEALARQGLGELRLQGVKCQEQDRLDDAIACYERYLLSRPRDTGIWNNLGVALRKLERFESAAVCYRRALEIAPDDPGLLGNLGNVLKDLDRIDEAIACHNRALAQRPDEFSLHQNFGITLREAARFAGALEQFDICLAMQPDHAKIQWDRALALLHLGRWEQGWEAYEARWSIGELPVRPYKVPRWQGEDINGKAILLYPEQGFGDTILASRFLPWVKARGATVILETKPPLRRLFANLDGVDRLVAPDEIHDGFDVHSSLMSLLGIFKVTPDKLPRLPKLTIPKEAQDRVAPLLRAAGNRFKIGVVWSGSVTFKGNRKRSVTPERFVGLAEIPGVQLYSLQKGPREVDLKDSGAGAVMIDVGSRVDDFAETAALLMGLDLVIMTDSSVAHLAGSLGRPVWDLLNYSTYWLYGGKGETTPWYPSLRLVRQPQPGDWDSVFARVKKELAAVVARWHAARRQQAGGSEPAAPGSAPGSADAEVALPSAFKREDGKPRFVMPLLRSSLSDPGINHLRIYESRFGGFEYAARHFFDRHLMPGDLFIDVGAHWGAFSLQAATRWPEDVEVLALEPVARNVERLRRAVSLNRLEGQIEVIAAAVGATSGKATMAPQSTMGHHVSAIFGDDGEPAAGGGEGGSEDEVVALTTLDQVLRERPQLDHKRTFLKIDVEGLEPEVIAGASELIRSGRVTAIAWERGRSYDQGERAEALAAMMKSLGDQGYSHWRFPNDTLGGPLMPYVPGPDMCNVYSLSLGFERRHDYARPPGPIGGPVRAPSPSFPEALRRKFIADLIAAKASDAARWADARCLEEGAEARASLAAAHLEGARRVLDVGAGLEMLRGKLSGEASYLPLDLVKRSADTLIADLNQGQFPEVAADDAVLLEVLEYIHDVPRLLRQCRETAGRLLFTYNLFEGGDREQRRDRGWFNDFTEKELKAMLAAAGWHLERQEAGAGTRLFIARRG